MRYRRSGSYGWGELISSIVGLVFSCFVIWLLTMMIYSLAADADCLEAGYPEVKVSWKYDAYCVTLQGDVTVAVDELEE